MFKHVFFYWYICTHLIKLRICYTCQNHLEHLFILGTILLKLLHSCAFHAFSEGELWHLTNERPLMCACVNKGERNSTQFACTHTRGRNHTHIVLFLHGSFKGERFGFSNWILQLVSSLSNWYQVFLFPFSFGFERFFNWVQEAFQLLSRAFFDLNWCQELSSLC